MTAPPPMNLSAGARRMKRRIKLAAPGLTPRASTFSRHDPTLEVISVNVHAPRWRRAPLFGAALLFGVLAATPPARLHAQAPPPSVPSIPFEKYTLPNGLEVILHQDRSVPLVAVNIWYKVGSGDEKPGRTGFAHLFEHIMFMGSQNVPVGQFDVWLEAAGANNNGSTNGDRTNYYEWMPSNALPLALWLEADRMGNLLPTMSQSKLDLQRDVVKNERRQSYDNVPYGRAYETLLKAVYPAGHPYSWSTIGSMDDLSAASLEDVSNFFRTYYAPNNASLSIAGDFNADSVKRLIHENFGWIPRGPQIPERPNVPPVQIARDTFLVLEDRVQLPRVYNSWPTVRVLSEDDAALDALAYLLAGDKNSRLYEKLVYERQAAQDVSAGQQSSRLAGMFTIQVTPRPGRSPAELQAMVDEEIGRIAREGITERELSRARNVQLANMLDGLAGVLGKADQLNYYNYIAGDPDFIERDAARYRTLTAGQIQRAAQTYLTRPRVVLTVVPDGKRDLMVTGGIQ